MWYLSPFHGSTYTVCCLHLLLLVLVEGAGVVKAEWIRRFIRFFGLQGWIGNGLFQFFESK